VIRVTARVHVYLCKACTETLWNVDGQQLYVLNIFIGRKAHLSIALWTLNAIWEAYERSNGSKRGQYGTNIDSCNIYCDVSWCRYHLTRELAQILVSILIYLSLVIIN